MFSPSENHTFVGANLMAGIAAVKPQHWSCSASQWFCCVAA
jgi:hypothetical protein